MAQAPWPKQIIVTGQSFWQKWSNSSIFVYLMLFLLQLKLVWGMWQYKDLTYGDTASYFEMAHNWFNNF